ncbi:MAG: DHH family phosphoesterase [Candidatus Bipolaricaulaceae bacterium]
MWATLDQVHERLAAARRALVIGHIRPDGDDISSVAGLVYILRRAGKLARGCIADQLPWYYHALPGTDLIARPEEVRDFRFDTAITVDASELARIGEAQALLGGSPPDVTLDHHRTNPGFGRLNFCDPRCAATALIVHEIGKALVTVDAELAQILLLGIATDTGFFKYETANPAVLATAAELVQAGGSLPRIAAAVLENRTLAGLKLLARTLDTVTVTAGGKLAYGWVSAGMLRATGCSQEDAEGFVGEIRALHGVEVAILFVEPTPGQVHVSLRSKTHVDVSELAQALGGGGHPRAAGCVLTVPTLQHAIDKLIPLATTPFTK